MEQPQYSQLNSCNVLLMQISRWYYLTANQCNMFDPVLLFIIVICLFDLQCHGFTGCILHKRNFNRCTGTSLFSSKENEQPSIITTSSTSGDLEKLKAEEARLASLLASVRKQKLDVLRGMCLYVLFMMCLLCIPIDLTSY